MRVSVCLCLCARARVGGCARARVWVGVRAKLRACDCACVRGCFTSADFTEVFIIIVVSMIKVALSSSKCLIRASLARY